MKLNCSRIDLKTYINGTAGPGLSVRGSLDEPDDLTVPTYIGYAPETGERYQGWISQPIILNSLISEFTPYSATALHREVCARAPSRQS
jgi:hypothetical protein